MALAACTPTDAVKPPPADRFYFPTGVAFARPAMAAEGVLYVASSNFDKRFDFGSVIAVDLAKVGLPAFPSAAGQAPASPAISVTDLGIASDQQVVYVQSFAGQVGAYPLADGGTRLFVPSRAEGHLLQTIEASGASLSCYEPPQGGGNNCISTAPSLVANQASATGLPRLSSPYAVGVSPEGIVYVTGLDAIDSPFGSTKAWQASMFEMSALSPRVKDDDSPGVVDKGFFPAALPSSGVAVGSRYLFVAGRYNAHFDYRLVTLVDRVTHAITQPFLEQNFRVQDARGIALSSDEKRLYVVARYPDTLVVVAVNGAGTDAPALAIVHSVPLPEGPNEVQILQRPGRGDLVAVTCATAGKLVLYDADSGDLVKQVSAVGLQPYGIASERFALGARLFVTNFADGRVAVVDVPYDEPQAAAVVARLGKPQICDVTPTDASCVGVVP
jgi:DNA-binding beta-propeller fold protein YncE